MNLRKLALIIAIMAVAWPIMFISAPISGTMAGSISVVFDHLLGSGYWQSIPIVSLAPLMVVWAIYCVAIYMTIYILGHSSPSAPYPPVDENGRPMKLAFSSRSGRAVWVPRAYDNDTEVK